MKLKIPVFLLFFALISVNLEAQQNLILNLESARKHALDHNKNMLNADFAMEKAQLAVREAIANGLPQINASMDYSNALGAKISIRFNESMPASEIDIKPQSNFYLNVNQLIFSGNYIVGVQISKLAQNLSRLGYQKTELEVISAVTDAYYMVLISGESKAIITQNLNNLKELYKKTEALANVGIIEKTDVDQLFVQMNSLQNALSSAERQVELATNLLRLQLGASIETEIELTDNLTKLMEDAEVENMLITQFKVEDNIDFRMLQQQEFMTKKMVDMQKSNALPTLAAFYRYTYKLLKPDFDMTPTNMVGLQMNIPIFSSGVRNAQTKQALIDLKTTQNNKSLLADQLKTQEKQLRFNFNNALETFNNQKTNVEVSRRVYSSLKLKYEQGLISGLDLIGADNNYLRAESDYITAMMQVLNSRLYLEKLYGNIQ
ncbi:MAG: TolC family protein [Bacteroidetes bacterium]|jgi:outer membrane protein|nr:TolC family protein [Bacteroidota bacterium]